MISFWQTDPRLMASVNKFGCAALSSLYLMPDDFSTDQVNAIIQAGVFKGELDEECTILNWKSWLAGLRSEETIDHYPLSFSRKVLDPMYVCAEDEKQIIKWWLSNVHENHFTVGDGKGATLWDSMNRPDIMKAYASFVESVIVKVG